MRLRPPAPAPAGPEKPVNRRKIALPALVCAFVAGVWLNQSVGHKEWEAIRYGVFMQPREHPVDLIRYPFIFLYRRSHDEEIYFATASAILGQPYDQEALLRGGVPARFEHIVVPPDGRWHTPYVEVPFEYPPLALPFILAPRLVASTYTGYERAFGALMAACLVAACAVAIRIARRIEPDAKQSARRWWIASALLLAQGALSIQRLDASIALFLMLAVDAVTKRRAALVGVWTGLAASAKLLPALFLPVFAAVDRETYRRIRNLVVLGSGAALSVFAMLVLPFALAPGSLEVFGEYHARRGLQIESTLALLYGTVHALFIGPAPTAYGYGSNNLVGALPDALAQTTTPLTVLALAALVVWTARLPAPLEEAERVTRIVLATLTAAVILWLGGKVFSPQYMTWGIPLVLAIPAVPRVRATWLLFVALVLTQLYMRGYYDNLCEQRAPALITAGVRQIALVALAVVAVRAMRPRAKLVG
jgi:Glycosyltransferase family 87